MAARPSRKTPPNKGLKARSKNAAGAVMTQMTRTLTPHRKQQQNSAPNLRKEVIPIAYVYIISVSSARKEEIVILGRQSADSNISQSSPQYPSKKKNSLPKFNTSETRMN
jgi:hypothetical protein